MRARCFQLFGFDVMLDAEAKPQLLEVNGDPGLRTETPIFLAINAPMIADLLNLVGIVATRQSASATAECARNAAEAEARRYDRRVAAGWKRLLPSAECAGLLDGGE